MSYKQSWKFLDFRHWGRYNPSTEYDDPDDFADLETFSGETELGSSEDSSIADKNGKETREAKLERIRLGKWRCHSWDDGWEDGYNEEEE
jgi:hypothetical protein